MRQHGPALHSPDEITKLARRWVMFARRKYEVVLVRKLIIVSSDMVCLKIASGWGLASGLGGEVVRERDWVFVWLDIVIGCNRRAANSIPLPRNCIMACPWRASLDGGTGYGNRRHRRRYHVELSRVREAHLAKLSFAVYTKSNSIGVAERCVWQYAKTRGTLYPSSHLPHSNSLPGCRRKFSIVAFGAFCRFLASEISFCPR